MRWRLSQALWGARNTMTKMNAAIAIDVTALVDIDRAERDQQLFRAAEVADGAADLLRMGMRDLNRVERHIANREFDAARECCDRSLATFTRIGAKTAIGEAYKLQGILDRELGKFEQANCHFALALGLAEVGEDRLLQAETQIEWALLLLLRGRHEDGIKYLNRAVALFEGLGASDDGDFDVNLDRLEKLYLPAVEQWAALQFVRDVAQMQHAVRVADWSERLGRTMGVSGWQLLSLRAGALVHDIGKTLVLTPVDDEYSPIPELKSKGRLQVHSMAGQSLVQQLDFSADVQKIVRHHHEEFAGTGYPDGLSGEEIALGARIVAVADALDSLTSGVARPAMSLAAGFRALEQESGRLFDPAIVAALRFLPPPAPNGFAANLAHA